MWNLKASFWCKVTTLFLLTVLIVPLLIACGDDGDETTPVTTATPVITTTATNSQTATISPTASPQVTPTITSTKPVKIGVISAWSGPQAMLGSYLIDPTIKLVEWQVKQRGGILDGREVNVVKYDDAGTVTGGVSGANKLFYDEGVSTLSWAGVGGEATAVSNFAEENKILYVSLATLTWLTPEKPLKYTISLAALNEDRVAILANLISNDLKAKTVGILASTDVDSRFRASTLKEALKQAGINTVYEDYLEPTTTDFSPYLTKVQRSNPDVLATDLFSQENYVNIAKQIKELGGWGDIKFVGIEPAAAAISLPGAQGWYVLSIWVPGTTNPASIKYEQDYNQVLDKAPTTNHVYAYLALMTPIYAIELAGTDTDREAIAKAALSGSLEWDTPLGHAHWALPNPWYPGLSPMVTHVEGGKMLPYTASGATTPTAAPTTTGTHTGLDIDSTIGELVANETTAAVLEKWVPGLTTNPQLMAAYGMTLKDIAPMKATMFTAEVMAGIEKDLAAVK